MFSDPASSPGLHFGLTRPPLGVGRCLGSSPPKRRGHLALSVTSALIPWSKRCPRVPRTATTTFPTARAASGLCGATSGPSTHRRWRPLPLPTAPGALSATLAATGHFLPLYLPSHTGLCCRRRFVLPRSLALSCLFTFCHYGLAAETLFDLNSKKTTSTKHLPRKKTHNPPDTSQSTDIFQMLMDP